MVRAFEMAGARVALVHVDRLVAEPERVEAFDLIGFPGGFSYGDDIASGRILAVKLRERLAPALLGAAGRGVPMIGACNGFQVMVQVGLLPGPGTGEEWAGGDGRLPPQTVALTHNAGGRFINRWVRVRADPGSDCLWTRPLAELAAGDPVAAEDTLMLPIAHGEGRFVTASPAVLASLKAGGQVALAYAAGDNPNGSEADIAGICDPSGRILGLMPHPERYLDWALHPYWTRLSPAVRAGEPPGLAMFRAAVEAVGGGARAKPAGARSVPI
jgi:phosphoribosylformylglycinamidine synthase